jgi:hypothetical protein
VFKTVRSHSGIVGVCCVYRPLKPRLRLLQFSLCREANSKVIGCHARYFRIASINEQSVSFLIREQPRIDSSFASSVSQPQQGDRQVPDVTMFSMGQVGSLDIEGSRRTLSHVINYALSEIKDCIHCFPRTILAHRSVLAGTKSEIKTPPIPNVVHLHELIGCIKQYKTDRLTEADARLVTGKLSYACQQSILLPPDHIANLQGHQRAEAV